MIDLRSLLHHSSTVVECSTCNPNIKGSKPATGAGREKSNKPTINLCSLLCYSCTIVKYSTYKPKNKGSNPATCTGREIIIKN